MTTITLADIQAAREVLKGHVANSPCMYSRTLSEITGAEIYLKFENLQFTASFKERGALNKLVSLTPEQKKHGVIAASAGITRRACPTMRRDWASPAPSSCRSSHRT